MLQTESRLPDKLAVSLTDVLARGSHYQWKDSICSISQSCQCIHVSHTMTVAIKNWCNLSLLALFLDYVRCSLYHALLILHDPLTQIWWMIRDTIYFQNCPLPTAYCLLPHRPTEPSFSHSSLVLVREEGDGCSQWGYCRYDLFGDSDTIDRCIHTSSIFYFHECIFDIQLQYLDNHNIAFNFCIIFCDKVWV